MKLNRKMDTSGIALAIPVHTTPARIAEAHLVISYADVLKSIHTGALTAEKHWGRWMINLEDYENWKKAGFPPEPGLHWDYNLAAYVPNVVNGIPILV